MKILFVVQDVDYYPQMGICQLSAIAKEEGFEAELGILSKENVMDKIFIKNLFKKGYLVDLICYSGCTGEHKYYVEFNKKLCKRHYNKKELSCFLEKPITLIGGPHATFFPEVLEEGDFDYLIQGEAEIEFRKFLKRLKEGNLPHKRILKSDKLVHNLDKLPFPDRSLFYDNPLCKETGQLGTKHFQVGRGCPYDCSYCFNHALKKMYPGQKYVRRHSVDYVIKEIKKVRKKYPIEMIKFYDDVFTYGATPWLKEFAEKYPKEIGIPFFTLMRFDLMTDEVGRLLSKAGCKVLQISLETINTNIRNRILKRNMSKKQILDGWKICKKYGFTLILDTMLGLPTSTFQDELDSLNFLIDNGFEYSGFPIYQPYPKTELGEYCIKKGWFDGDYNKFHLAYNHHSVLSCYDKKYNKKLRNLSTLGTVAVRYPWLKWLITKVLIHLPYNKLYFLMFYFARMRFHAKRVYNYKHSWKEWWKILWKSLRVEKQKKEDEK